MEVTLIAHTNLVSTFENGSFQEIHNWLDPEKDGVAMGGQDADMLAEFSGRACYQAWDRPNPKTAENIGYLANILAQRHFSVLEHASATFYVTGVSRSLTHELVRHRHLSYSQLSQRYVNESDVEMVRPPGIPDSEWHVLRRLARESRKYYRSLVSTLINEGFNRKEARQAARAVLPNMTETKIVVTGNMRAWRDMLEKRFHVAADAEIREFAKIVLSQLRSIAPNTFQDIPEEPYGSK